MQRRSPTAPPQRANSAPDLSEKSMSLRDVFNRSFGESQPLHVEGYKDEVAEMEDFSQLDEELPAHARNHRNDRHSITVGKMTVPLNALGAAVFVVVVILMMLSVSNIVPNPPTPSPTPEPTFAPTDFPTATPTIPPKPVVAFGRTYDPLTTTAIDLFNAELDGTIPHSLGMLTYLTRLSMHDDGLVGNIPSELGLLTKLTRLSLNDNRLVGSIPSEIGLLTKLTRLSLRDNHLSGTIPQALCEDAALTHIEHDCEPYDKYPVACPCDHGCYCAPPDQRKRGLQAEEEEEDEKMNEEGDEKK